MKKAVNYIPTNSIFKAKKFYKFNFCNLALTKLQFLSLVCFAERINSFSDSTFHP